MIASADDKSELLKVIIKKLESVHQGAVDAAQRAYDTATDEENEAENKYDTLGLEASYLAHGQVQRVKECEADLIKFKQITNKISLSKAPISIGSLVCIEDEKSNVKWVFLSPVAGGLKVSFSDIEISLLTSSAPLGKLLMSKILGDEIEMITEFKRTYIITNVL